MERNPLLFVIVESITAFSCSVKLLSFLTFKQFGGDTVVIVETVLDG